MDIGFKILESPEMVGERIKVSELVQILGVSKRTIYNWFEEGLKYEVEYVIGRKPYKVTTLEEIDRFMSLRGMQHLKEVEE